jgi:hypothetical protein
VENTPQEPTIPVSKQGTLRDEAAPNAQARKEGSMEQGSNQKRLENNTSSTSTIPVTEPTL